MDHQYGEGQLRGTFLQNIATIVNKFTPCELYPEKGSVLLLPGITKINIELVAMHRPCTKQGLTMVHRTQLY